MRIYLNKANYISTHLNNYLGWHRLPMKEKIFESNNRRLILIK
jgi:hypothetical protein